MLYPYPILDKNGQQVNLTKTIEDLATTKSNCPFCKEPKNSYALDFDRIKREIQRVRKGELRSVDGFYRSREGKYVFIEFKHETKGELLKRGTAQDSHHCKHNGKVRPTIQVVLRQKAIDSLSIAAFSELRTVTMMDIQKNAVLIVVHADDSETPSIGDIVKNLRRLSSSAINPPKRPILWDLEELKTMGFFRDVCTWTESDFAQYGKEYLR